MDNPRHTHLRLCAQLEQLAAGLREYDPTAERTARSILARVATRGSCAILTQVFAGIVQTMDDDQTEWERLA